MEGLLVLVFVLWVVAKILGSNKKKQQSGGGRQPERSVAGHPRSQAELIEQQRQRAEEYRRRAEQSPLESWFRERSEPATDPSGPAADRRDGREHPWEAPPPAARRQQAGPARNGLARPRQQAADPLCAVPEAHTSPPPLPPRAAATPLFDRGELARAIVMSEILGPCKARRP